MPMDMACHSIWKNWHFHLKRGHFWISNACCSKRLEMEINYERNCVEKIVDSLFFKRISIIVRSCDSNSTFRFSNITTQSIKCDVCKLFLWRLQVVITIGCDDYELWHLWVVMSIRCDIFELWLLKVVTS